MNIDIDIYLLISKEITASEFLILYMLNKKQYDLLNAYLASHEFKDFELQIKHLIELGFLLKFDYFTPLDIRGYSLTDEGLKIVCVGTEDLFDEFLQEYPDKVISNGALRYLKSDLTKCRVKYNRLVKGKRYLHEKMLKCIRFEIASRERNGGMMYFKKLSNWLETEEWKAYENDALNNNIIKQQQYGTSLE